MANVARPVYIGLYIHVDNLWKCWDNEERIAVTLTHALAETIRHPRSAPRRFSSLVSDSVEAMREHRDAASYRANFGAASYSAEDIADLWADENCPVNKRPGLA